MTRTKPMSGTRPDGPATSMAGSPLTYHQMFGPAARAQADGLKQLVRITHAHLEFLARRLDRDSGLVSDLATVTTPAEALPVLTTFLQAAQQDYVEEVRQVMEVWTDGARAATADIQHQIQEAVATATNDALAASSRATPQEAD